ncbi:hypothetical protein IAU59_003962 [Kwoniella sp. CBS 9459]
MSATSTALVPFHPSTVATTDDASDFSGSDSSAVVRSNTHIPQDSTTEQMTALGDESGHSNVTDYLVKSAHALRNGRTPEPQSEAVVQSMGDWYSKNPQQAEEAFNLGGKLLESAAASRGVDVETDESHLLTEGDSFEDDGTERSVIPFGGANVRVPAHTGTSMVPYERNTVAAPSQTINHSLAPSGGYSSNNFDALRRKHLTKYPTTRSGFRNAGPQLQTRGFADHQQPRRTFTDGQALSQFQSVVGGILGRFKEQMVREDGGFHMTSESPDGSKTERGFTSGVMDDGTRVSCSVFSTSFKGQAPGDGGEMMSRMSQALDSSFRFPTMRSGLSGLERPGPSSEIMTPGHQFVI